MKKFLTLALLGVLAACQPNKPTPPNCPPADPNVICAPTDVGDANTVCPPAPECPAAPACPDCPPPAPPPECPVPPPPPAYDDVEHAMTEFDVTAVLAQKDTLGLYVADPNGQYQEAVFAMPELVQKEEYVEILGLKTEGSDDMTAIGNTQGRYSEEQLIVSVICDREFGSACSATVVTNGPFISEVKIHVNATEKDYAWRKKE